MNLKHYRRVHCVGIGGIGLSALAEILLSRGYAVSGSDIKESPVTQHLVSLGARICLGHEAANLGEADLLVYSAAVARDNPELVEARRRGLKAISRAELLGSIMADYPISVAVSGTHGKTTTTSMIALMLERAGLQPTILIGGVLDAIGSNVKVGEGPYFVTEACEYMDSFLHLKPTMEVILNIDSDHLDYFRDIEHIADSFRSFTGLVPESGTVVAYDANAFVDSAVADLSCSVVRFGFNQGSGYSARNIRFDGQGCPCYDLHVLDQPPRQVCLAVPGEHNVVNSLAAIAVCSELGVPFPVIQETLLEFTGAKRRFDLRGTTEGGVIVVDDYAHHPTEVAATLSAVSHVPHQRLFCLFQPHTYTRTLALFDEFARALAGADVIVLAEIYAARERNIQQISSKSLAERIRQLYPDKEVHFIPDFEAMADFAVQEARSGDMVMTMGAGDIDRVGELILERGRG